MADEGLAEAVKKVEVPGERQSQEEKQAEEEGGAQAATKIRIEDEEEEKGDEEGSAGGAFAHEGDGEACPEEIPAGSCAEGGLVEEVGEADQGEEGTEGEERVGFTDAGDVKEAEGGEKDDGGEPSR